MSNEYRSGGRGRDGFVREEPRLDLRAEPARQRPAAPGANPYDRAPAQRPAEPPRAPSPRAEAYAPQTYDDDDDGDFAPPPYSAGAYGRDDYAGDDDGYDEAPPRRRRTRWAPVIIAALALVGFAAVVWYAYDWGSGNTRIGEPPVIQADGAEIKSRPDAEGGIEVPNQDATILNPGAEESGAEVLLPPPEEPVTPPPAPAPAEPAAAAAPAPAAEDEPGAEEGLGDIGDLVEQEIGPDAVDGTVADGAAATGAAAESAAPPSPPPAPVETATAPAAAEQPIGAPQPLVPDTAPAATAPAATEQPATTQPTTTQPAAPAPATEVASGSFLIQLAALTSPEAARAAWAKMQQKHPSLLGDMALVVQEIEIEGKGKFYRVQAGPLPNRATADDLCAQLKAQKQDCIVVKR